MATLGSSYVDLHDVYKLQDPKGGTAEVIEMLMELNPVMADAHAIECNNGTSHVHTIRTGIPLPTWQQMYKGAPQSKSEFAQVVDTCGFMENSCLVDTRVLERSNSPAHVRNSQATGVLEGFSQEFQSTFFYGNTATSPLEFTGLAPRFNDTSAPNGNQIIDGGAVGSDNTSIWFVTWGDDYLATLYPQGSKAGVDRMDKGEQRVHDSDGNAYYAMEELFRQHVGLTLGDWRGVARIANIDVSAALAGDVDLNALMMKAYRKVKAGQKRGGVSGRVVIYCNSDILEALDIISRNAGTNDNYIRLTPMEIQGKEIETFRKIPIRETDAIVNDEDLVS